MSSKNYTEAYSLLFTPPEVMGEPLLYRFFCPTVKQEDQRATNRLLSKAMDVYTHITDEERQEIASRIIATLYDDWEQQPVERLQPVFDCIIALMDMEPALFQEPKIGDHLTMKEEAEYRAYLVECIKIHSDVQDAISQWSTVIVAALTPLCATPLPRHEEGILIGEEPLLSFLEGGEVGENLWHMWFVEDNYHKPLKKQLWRNLCNLNGVADNDHKVNVKPPSVFLEKDKSKCQILFSNTPLWGVLNIPVPIYLPTKTRFEHHHVCAGTGAGKTRMFENLIVNDLPDVLRKNASIVVIEPDGSLIERLSKLDIWREFTERLTIIDPRDIEHPIALNMFDVNTERLSTYSPLIREQLQNSAVELLEYVFSSLLASELSGRQSAIFRYVVRCVLAIPGANIHTLRELFEPEGYKKYEPIAVTLPGAAGHFFKNEWNAPALKQTKSAVLIRIWQLLENSTFERMFSSPRSRLDLTAELNEGGRLILINTAQDLLKKQGSELFGRLFIALITQAALERASIPESQRKPVFVYIDEASPYIDQNIELILTQARKYKVGLILAHQHLGQISNDILKTISSNTSIKMASGVSHEDATVLSRNMNCDAPYIRGMKKLQFATYIKGSTETAVKYNVRFDMLDDLPTMSASDYANVKQAMRDRYSIPLVVTPPHSTPPPQQPQQPQQSYPQPEPVDETAPKPPLK